MTARDLLWRAAGAALMLGGCCAGLLDREGSPLAILYFLSAMSGIVLMIHGKRVGIVWAAERRGHQQTAAAIHTQRVRRRALRR